MIYLSSPAFKTNISTFIFQPGYQMKITLVILFFTMPFFLLAQDKGKILFETHCASCHGISEGAFGPRLGGVHKVRNDDEFTRFVKNPASFLAGNDTRTKALFEKYKTEMPGFTKLKKKEIIAILTYIKTESEEQNMQPLSLNSLFVKNAGQRYAPPVKSSNLFIEVEDFVQIPRTDEHLDDKGITVLRSTKFGVFVSDQMGKIYRISNRKPEVYFDVRLLNPDFIFFPSIGAGLGNFTFHPDFENNGLLYTSHLEKYTGKRAINEGDWPDSLKSGQQYVLTEWKTADPAAFPFTGNRREILRINNPNFAHSAQDLAFAPGLDKQNPDYGMLYYSFGDGGSANLKIPEISHNIRSVLGSVMRIDPQGNNGVFASYGIPADNPFSSSLDPLVQKEIYAFGFRNPYRLSWDEKGDGALYVADIGESNVEEINRVQKGGDYGWASQEGKYGIDVKTDKTVLFEREDQGINQTILPVATFDHNDGNAICGGYIYEGNLEPLKRKYFFGDIVSGRLFFTDVDNLSNGIFDLHLLQNGKETTMQQLCGIKRTHLRVGYDNIGGDLYLLTKPDNVVRRIKNAYWK